MASLEEEVRSRRFDPPVINSQAPTLEDLQKEDTLK